MILKILGISATVFGALLLFVLFFGETNNFFLTLLWGVVLLYIGIFILKKTKKRKEPPKRKENFVQKISRTDKEAEIRAENRRKYLEQKQAEFDTAVASIPRVPVQVAEKKVNREKEINVPDIQPTNITRSTVIDKLFPLVVLDTETTGIRIGGNDIIEVSAIKYEKGFVPVSCFTTLCKPRKPIPADATEINNITDEMVADSPNFGYIAQAFSDYIAGCNIAGHNVRFDIKFLFVSGVQLPPKAKYYDTLELAKKTLTKHGSKKYNHKTGEYEENYDYDVWDYKLETLCGYYDIYRSDAHRSLSDCYATGLLLQNLIADKTG